MKKIFIAFLILLVVATPGALAQESLYVESMNIEYGLEDNYAQVTEDINFVIEPFALEGPVTINRGDARSMLVEINPPLPYEIVTEGQKVVKIDMGKAGTRFVNVRMKYRRSDFLYEFKGVKFIETLGLGGPYPWNVYSANITFNIPDGYFYGAVIPESDLIQTDGFNQVKYILTPLQLYEGMPLKIEYARFKDLSDAKGTIVSDLLGDAERNVLDATQDVENARKYGELPKETIIEFEESKADLENSKDEFRVSQDFKSTQDYYNSYAHALFAESYAKNASRKARNVIKSMDFFIQEGLEQRIDTIVPSNASNREKGELGELSNGTTGGNNRTGSFEVVDFNPDGEASSKLLGFMKILAVAIVLAAALYGVLVFLKSRPPVGTKRRVSVEEFSSISNLKRKTFEGFEENMDIIRKSSVIANNIRRLQKKKEGFVSSLEMARREMVLGKIDEKEYEKKRMIIEKNIDDVDRSINELEREIQRLKKT